MSDSDSEREWHDDRYVEQIARRAELDRRFRALQKFRENEDPGNNRGQALTGRAALKRSSRVQKLVGRAVEDEPPRTNVGQAIATGTDCFESWHGGDYEESEDLRPSRNRFTNWKRLDNGCIEIFNPRPSEAASILCKICKTFRPHTEEEATFILCSNHQCNFQGGGHHDCLGFDKLPAEQWFCKGCVGTLSCCVCDGTLSRTKCMVACSFCELVGHRECMNPKLSTDALCDDNWLCSACDCEGCDGQDNGERLNEFVQCRECRNRWHSSCFRSSFIEAGLEATRVAGDRMWCLPCFHAADKARLDADKDEIADDESDLDVETMFRALSADYDQSFEEAALIAEFGDERTTILAMYRQRLEKLKAKEPMLYFALTEAMETGLVLNDRRWLRLVDLIHNYAPHIDLNKERPPRNLHRVLDRLFPIKLDTRWLSVNIGEIEIRSPFKYRGLVSVASQLLQSPTSARNVPLYKATGEDCSAQSRYGPRLVELERSFRVAKEVQPEHDVYAVQLYSDFTSTNFSGFHPIEASIFNMDRGGKVLNMNTAHALIGLAPTAVNFRYYHKGVEKSEAFAFALEKELNKAEIKRQMLRQVASVIMEGFEELERGVVIDGNSSGTIAGNKAHFFLYSWITDMDERRHLLNMSLAPHWQCTHCYGRPVPGCKPCPIPRLWMLVERSMPRDFDSLERFAKRLTAEEKAMFSIAGKEAWSFASCFGIEFGSSSPFDPKKNFLVGGPASYFLFDRLHMLDGVITRICDFLNKFYGCNSLIACSQTLGNTACGVSNGKHFHRMEEGLHDFQFLIVALLSGSSVSQKRGLRNGSLLDQPVESATQEKRFRGDLPDVVTAQSRHDCHLRLLTSLLRIVVILKDDAPGLLQKLLESSIEELEESLNFFRADLNLQGIPFEDTSKIHELLKHCAEQVKANGPASGFTSDAYEWNHQYLKHLQDFGSSRTDDKYSTMLKQSVYNVLLTEVQNAAERPLYCPIEPYAPVAVFHIKRQIAAPLPALALLQKNVEFLEEQYGSLFSREWSGQAIAKARSLLEDTNSGYDLERSIYGNSVACDLRCAKRGCAIKATLLCEVIRSKPQVGRRGHRVLAFGTSPIPGPQPGDEIDANEKSSAACCRHHDPSCELHCSFARLRQSDTVYGIPLIFFDAVCQQAKRKGPFALVLRLEAATTETAWAFKDVVAPYHLPPDAKVEIHSLSRLRTSCLVIESQEIFHVMVSGARTFKHLQ